MFIINRILFVTLFLASTGAILAQDNPATPAPAPDKSKPSASSKAAASTHKFWDNENIGLFAGVGATRMLDYASTRHLRDNRDNEWLLSNSIVDNRPLFVGIEIAGTAASIAVSYLFHRTGHHTLERWVSIAHIGVGVGGSIRNYALKPGPIAEPVLAIKPAR